MTDSESDKKKGKNIWSRITFNQFVDTVATLGDRTDQLKGEPWRLKVKTRAPGSLWGEVINKLKLDDNEGTRHALYDVWHVGRHDVHELVERKKRIIGGDKSDGDDGNIDVTETISVQVGNNPTLHPDPSLPLPQRPDTRANRKENANDNSTKSDFIGEVSMVLSPIEWKDAFSRTDQKMKPDWTDIFVDKLTPAIAECSVNFKAPYIKKGERKRVCKFFCFYAICTIGKCKRKYQVSLRNQPDNNSTALFLVRIFGELNHDINNGTSTRQLRGKKRLLVGKRANEVGPVQVFRENIEHADENLLAAGNFTGCATIETTKKAAADYRKKMHIDEDIFTECRIIGRVYRTADVTSEYVQGYIQVKGEMPFRVHLFSEPQIERYIRYCTKAKYSFVHIDATGGVLKTMCEQKQSLLYAIIFKDGNDAIDTTALAHAVLTDHTVPSISYFFGNVAYNITQVKRKLVLPSFFVIDFSAALMNAILQSFNVENINTHLNRCWNVVCGKYNARQLRSLSFIHFCCCHVMHAVARSLTDARVDKKIRRGVLYIFASVLCGNDIKKLYDILGSIINIFGDPNEQNAKEIFQQMISLQLNVDEESVSMLSNGKKIFKKAKNNKDELRTVDEYLRSNTPIIHQSPFNEEAIRLYPYLATLINKKSKFGKIINPLFSPSIIRIFYRWWAYLPLWTGLLWNFEERYSSNKKTNVSIMYNPVRHSNALIESYFRTVKKSIYQGKVNTRPSNVIMELYRSVQAQLKAIKFGVMQSSKGRKRKKKMIGDEENWGAGEKSRTVYFDKIDKFASKRARAKINDAQSDDVTKKFSDSEETTTVSSSDKSTPPSDESDDDISSNKSSRPSSNNSTSSSSIPNSMVGSEHSIDVPVNSDKATTDNDDHDNDDNDDDDDDEQSEALNEYNCDMNNRSPVTSTLYPMNYEPIVTTDQSQKTRHPQYSTQSEIIIDGHTLRWPKFGIKNALFEGRSYTLTLTCPIDSALFALYFLYRSDINIAEELDNAPRTSPYSTLVKVFHLVEKEGWDAARISWLLNFNLLKPTDRQPKSLFGSVDEQVFCFITTQQRHSNKITCSRPDCKQRVRNYSTTELRILSSETHIVKFEAEDVGVCGTMIKRYAEMTPADALKQKYKDGKVPLINYETNRTENVRGWICNDVVVSSIATFDYDYPPIIVANIEQYSKRSEEGYVANPVRLRDVKRVISIGCIKYKLRAVIHNKNAHFTTTVIGNDDTLYIFDDRKGVREVRNSTDLVEYGIYSQIYEF